MNVNINTITTVAYKKLDASKQPYKKEEFKRVLDNQESRPKNSSNESVDKKYNEDKDLNETNKANSENKNDDVEKNTVEGSNQKDLNNPADNDNLKSKTINFIETLVDTLKQNIEKPAKELGSEDKSAEEMAQIQQLLQFLNSMLQNTNETSTIEKGKVELDSINVEKLISGEKLSPDAKLTLKNNLSEIVALLEKSKGNNEVSSKILDVLKKLTTEVSGIKEDLSLLKIPNFQSVSGKSEDKPLKDNLLKSLIEQNTKTASEILPKNQTQSSSDAGGGSKSSGNSSFEEKFLNTLLGEDKDEMKISKAVNFMNQFETVKTLDTSKVQTPSLVIDRNNFQADVIKTMKFMEINNIKDLTVKMNPKELGEITIKITMESGIMKANISAQNKDTFNLLNHNIQDISDKLKNMDIKIQSLDINIYEDSTFFNKGSNEKNDDGRQNNNKGINVILEEDEDISNNYAIEENQVNKFV